MKKQALSLLWSRRWHSRPGHVFHIVSTCVDRRPVVASADYVHVSQDTEKYGHMHFISTVSGEHVNLMFMNIIRESLLLLLPASVTFGQKLWIRIHIFHHICAWSEGSQWDLQLNWCISFQASSGLPDTSVNWNRWGPCSPTNGPSVHDARKHTRAWERYPFTENIFPCSLLREIF